jgi:hypothetical protein
VGGEEMMHGQEIITIDATDSDHVQAQELTALLETKFPAALFYMVIGDGIAITSYHDCDIKYLLPMLEDTVEGMRCRIDENKSNSG